MLIRLGLQLPVAKLLIGFFTSPDLAKPFEGKERLLLTQKPAVFHCPAVSPLGAKCPTAIEFKVSAAEKK